MKYYTNEDVEAFIYDGKHSHPREWFFAKEFWENRTKEGAQPDLDNPHYAGLNRCWGWNGRTLGGYAVINVFEKTIGAHRMSYTIHHGPIPDGMLVMHKCDNKICTNPEHLEVGTQRQNIKDAHKRGLVKKGKEKSNIGKPELFLAIIDRIVDAWDRSSYDIFFGEGQKKQDEVHLFQERLKTAVLESFRLFKPGMLGRIANEEIESEKTIRKRLNQRIENPDALFTSDTISQWLYEESFGGYQETKNLPYQ